MNFLKNANKLQRFTCTKANFPSMDDLGPTLLMSQQRNFGYNIYFTDKGIIGGSYNWQQMHVVTFPVDAQLVSAKLQEVYPDATNVPTQEFNETKQNILKDLRGEANPVEKIVNIIWDEAEKVLALFSKSPAHVTFLKRFTTDLVQPSDRISFGRALTKFLLYMHYHEADIPLKTLVSEYNKTTCRQPKSSIMNTMIKVLEDNGAALTTGKTLFTVRGVKSISFKTDDFSLFIKEVQELRPLSGNVTINNLMYVVPYGNVDVSVVIDSNGKSWVSWPSKIQPITNSRGIVDPAALDDNVEAVMLFAKDMAEKLDTLFYKNSAVEPCIEELSAATLGKNGS